MTAKEIAEKASAIVVGERNEDYGSPLMNHSRTAALINAYVVAKVQGGPLEALTAEDVCKINILQKLSRDMNSPKEDNLVDIIGYTLNIAMIRDELAGRNQGPGPEASEGDSEDTEPAGEEEGSPEPEKIGPPGR